MWFWPTICQSCMTLRKAWLGVDKIALQRGGWWISSDDTQLSTSYAWLLRGFYWTAAHLAPDTTKISTELEKKPLHMTGSWTDWSNFWHCHPLQKSSPTIYMSPWTTWSMTSDWQDLPILCLSKIIHTHTNKCFKTADLPSWLQMPLKPLRTLLKQFAKCKSHSLIQTISMPVLVSDFYQALYLLDIVSVIGQQSHWLTK